MDMKNAYRMLPATASESRAIDMEQTIHTYRLQSRATRWVFLHVCSSGLSMTLGVRPAQRREICGMRCDRIRTQFKIKFAKGSKTESRAVAKKESDNDEAAAYICKPAKTQFAANDTETQRKE
jgi:hypothetical protein